ncbi:hypothetical protein GCM10027456_21270 [Kineosporia babensis]
MRAPRGGVAAEEPRNVGTISRTNALASSPSAVLRTGLESDDPPENLLRTSSGIPNAPIVTFPDQTGAADR